jgi:hypothetical protein
MRLRVPPQQLRPRDRALQQIFETGDPHRVFDVGLSQYTQPRFLKKAADGVRPGFQLREALGDGALLVVVVHLNETMIRHRGYGGSTFTFAQPSNHSGVTGRTIQPLPNYAVGSGFGGRVGRRLPRRSEMGMSDGGAARAPALLHRLVVRCEIVLPANAQSVPVQFDDLVTRLSVCSSACGLDRDRPFDLPEGD